MCCKPKHEQYRGPHSADRCECGCCGPSFRRFVSKKERMEHLEEYKAEIQKELEAVNEHLKELAG